MIGPQTIKQLNDIQGLLNQLTPLQIYVSGLLSGSIIGFIVGVILL